ncbi:MAG TPA: hypothetical protein VIJ51_05690 [Solirubrobacteraceae bacterium]
MLGSDPQVTAARVEELRAYMEANVLSPSDDFICDHCPECRASIKDGDRFFEGQLSHVGRHYDMTVDGEPRRVVVVGQEYGLDKPRVSLDERYEAIHDGSGLGRRYYSDGEHRGRNPHMRGTTSALRLAFGREPGADHEGEFLDTPADGPFHIFDAFALVNVLLCSAGPVGSSVGRSTRTMRQNCAEHFARTLQILEPTLLILQGKGVYEWLKPIIEQEETVITDHLAYATVAGLPVLMCMFSHPSARGPLRWGDSLDAPYLRDTVRPTLQNAIKRRPLETSSPIAPSDSWPRDSDAFVVRCTDGRTLDLGSKADHWRVFEQIMDATGGSSNGGAWSYVFGLEADKAYDPGDVERLRGEATDILRRLDLALAGDARKMLHRLERFE